MIMETQHVKTKKSVTFINVLPVEEHTEQQLASNTNRLDNQKLSVTKLASQIKAKKLWRFVRSVFRIRASFTAALVHHDVKDQPRAKCSIQKPSLTSIQIDYPQQYTIQDHEQEIAVLNEVIKSKDAEINYLNSVLEQVAIEFTKKDEEQQKQKQVSPQNSIDMEEDPRKDNRTFFSRKKSSRNGNPMMLSYDFQDTAPVSNMCIVM